MKSKIVSVVGILFSWATLSASTAPASPCTDEETVAINQAHPQAGLNLDQAVIARLQKADAIAMVNASILR